MYFGVYIGSIACIGNRVCIALFCILPAHFVVLNLEIIEYARCDMHSRHALPYDFYVCRAQDRERTDDEEKKRHKQRIMSLCDFESKEKNEKREKKTI